MKKVFISHPFAKDKLINRMKAEKICRDIKGVIPISPLHLFGFMDNDTHREEIMKVCYNLIDICDEVWVYGDSEGCRKEKEYAELKGKRVVVINGKTEEQNTDTR